jgi:tetratricopeptide (TPR) repeat protein
MDGAFEFYQKALKLDPEIYEAALFSGDAMTQKQRFDEAEKWYMAAAAINPFRETAYRYSATPLMKQHKYDEAKMRYIEAYITEPYNRYATGGMIQWAQVVGKRVGHPKIDIPASVDKGADGNVSIKVGAGDKDDDGSFAWTAYGISRALWMTGKDGKLSDTFHKKYPTETVYRHTLAEEFDGLKMVATTVKEAMARKN